MVTLCNLSSFLIQYPALFSSCVVSKLYLARNLILCTLICLLGGSLINSMIRSRSINLVFYVKTWIIPSKISSRTNSHFGINIYNCLETCNLHHIFMIGSHSLVSAIKVDAHVLTLAGFTA